MTPDLTVFNGSLVDDWLTVSSFFVLKICLQSLDLANDWPAVNRSFPDDWLTASRILSHNWPKGTTAELI